MVHLLQANDDVIDAIPRLYDLATRAVPTAASQTNAAPETPWT